MVVEAFRFARCRRQWDIQNSLLDAFETFFLLSYVKFLSVSFDILMPTFSWDMKSTMQSPVVYYDGTLEYFGLEHLPYALLAFAVLIVFTFCPILLLCVYPCHWFHRCLNTYHLSSPALHTFMDTFQGSYKDGTNGSLLEWNQRLPIFCSHLFDDPCGTLFICRNLHCHFQHFHDKWCPSCCHCVTCSVPTIQGVAV